MSVNDSELEVLQENGKLVELFCLRPKIYKDNLVTLRVKIDSKWCGWKLRDDLVTCLGLEVGNTIVATVVPQYTEGFSAEVNKLDLFASGKNIDWLIENKISIGSVIDCKVKFSYIKAPIGINGREVFKASLIFENGIKVIHETSKINESETEKPPIDDFFKNIADNISELV